MKQSRNLLDPGDKRYAHRPVETFLLWSGQTRHQKPHYDAEHQSLHIAMAVLDMSDRGV